MKNRWKRFLPAVMVLFLLPVLTSCGEADRSFAEGNRYFQAESYEDALKKYQLAVSQGKCDAESYAALSLAYLWCGNHEEAKVSMEKALSYGKTVPKVQLQAGAYYLAEGQPETAAPFFRAVTETVSGGELRQEAESFLAECLYQCGSYEEAAPIYLKLVQEGVYAAPHEVRLGLCYLKQGQVYAATQCFSALSEEPDQEPLYYVQIYRGLTEAGERRKAEDYFQAGLSYTGDSMSVPEYYAACGKLKSLQEKFSTDDRISGRLLEAAYFTEHEDYEGAETVYTEILPKAEEYPEIYVSYMKYQILRGNYDGALQTYSMIRLSDSEEAIRDAAWNEMMLYEIQSDYQTAFEKLKEYRKQYGAAGEAEREYRFLERITLGY